MRVGKAYCVDDTMAYRKKAKFSNLVGDAIAGEKH